MQDQSNIQSSAVSRRQFLKNSSLAAASVAAVAGFPSILHAQAKQPINAVVIGLGGRGSDASKNNFMEAAKIVGVDAKIVAVADLFPNKAAAGIDLFGLPANRCFSGFDAYMKALEVPGVNYAILATPPGFRAPHFKACVEAGKNVFMEKPVAVDGPTCRMIYEAGEVAKQKNLKVAAGTQRRHEASYMETIKRLHDGAIGDIMTLRVYWVNGGPIWHRGDHGDSDLERQINNWYHYIWLSGDHICEQHVHNLDVGNWVMNAHPVKCWGMGARQMLDGKSGEIWDNFAIEYEYASGARMYAYCGQIVRAWSSVSEGVQGTKGASNPGGSISPKDGAAWRFRGRAVGAYVQEHVDLINAILNDTPLNEAKQVADSTLTAIMGREAAYSGAEVEWDAILNSKFAYAPELLYQDCARMQYGPFRTLQSPLPGQHNIFKDQVPAVNA